MKVIISAYTCCPNRGSEPGNGWNWIMGYVRNNYEVYCVTSSKNKSEIDAYLNLNKIENLNFFFTDNKFSLALLKIPVLGIYLHYYTWLYYGRKIILNLINNHTFSHSHHVTYSSIKFGTPLYNLSVPIILGPLGGGEMPHITFKKYLGKSYYFEKIKNTVSALLAKLNPTVSKSIKSADRILVSNNLTEEFLRSYTTKVFEPMFDAGLSDYFENTFIERNFNTTIQIIWIGRMLPRKGLNLAVEAVAHLPSTFNFHFSIVGEGETMHEAQSMVAKYGIHDKVSFLGKLPHNELIDLLSKSHVFLFPSLIDSCPMQVFEAMSMGLPVVTLNHQGMKDQVTERCGVKVDVGYGIQYPQMLADAILKVVYSEEEYQRYSKSAWERGQAQLWKPRIDKFINSLNYK